MNVICIQRSVASCRLLTSSSSQFVLDSGNSGEIPTAWVVVPENTYQCHLDSLWIFRHWQDPLQLKPVTHMRHFRNQQQENIVAEYHTVATIAKPRNLHISYFYVVFVCTSQLRRKILVCMIIWHNPVAACIKLSSSTIKEFYVTVAWNKIETPSGNTIIDLRKYSWSDTFQLVTLRLTPAFHWPCNENTWLTDNSAHSNRA